MKPPTSPLVAVAWLRTLPDLAGAVATTRPTGTGWSATGFVVASVVGDSSDPELPGGRRPVLSLDAWGVSPGSSLPPRGQAAGLLESVRDAVETFTPIRVTPGPAGIYAPALVQSVWLVTGEPREIDDPDGAYAHFTIDIGMTWVRTG